MAVIGHGIDLVETSRVEKVWRDHSDRFLERILTSGERAYCARHKNALPHVAGRFAAKEAVLKALGTGWRGRIAWTDIEILNDESGQPRVRLGGYTAEVAAALGIRRILVSITHAEHYAAASAIGLSE